MEKNITYSIQHQCHQCGAPVTIEEDTRYFVCEFCRVRSCISQNSFPRYRFSPSAAAAAQARLFYLPYWRFKGTRYACSAAGVSHKFLDISRIAVRDIPKSIPVSLGLRSQAVKLKFITQAVNARFLKPDSYRETILEPDRRHPPPSTAVDTFEEDIGETISLIYSPFYLKDDTVFDGILDTPLSPADPETFNISNFAACRPEKEIFFIPGLCPSCGADLDGQPDSLVLSCANCQTLWRPHGKELAKIKFACARVKDERDVLIPFWKIEAGLSTLTLRTQEDLMKFTNRTDVTQSVSASRLISFWAPAFKIRPRFFLKLATQLTASQPEEAVTREFQNNTLYAANLPASEAVESIRVSLSNLAKPASRYLEQLSRTEITPAVIQLVYLAFKTGTHELIHPGTRITINKNSLKLAGNL